MHVGGIGSSKKEDHKGRPEQAASLSIGILHGGKVSLSPKALAPSERERRGSNP